jgi:hypothetical protein
MLEGNENCGVTVGTSEVASIRPAPSVWIKFLATAFVKD